MFKIYSIFGELFMIKKLMIMVACLCSACTASNSFAMEVKNENKQKEPKWDYSFGKYHDSINVAAVIYNDPCGEKVVINVNKDLRNGEFSCVKYEKSKTGIFNKSEKIDYPEIVKILKERIVEIEKKSQIEMQSK
jgi:hypothetical protein